MITQATLVTERLFAEEEGELEEGRAHGYRVHNLTGIRINARVMNRVTVHVRRRWKERVLVCRWFVYMSRDVYANLNFFFFFFFLYEPNESWRSVLSDK